MIVEILSRPNNLLLKVEVDDSSLSIVESYSDGLHASLDHAIRNGIKYPKGFPLYKYNASTSEPRVLLKNWIELLKKFSSRYFSIEKLDDGEIL